MTIHVTPIPRLTNLVAPAFTLGTANTAGAAITAVSSNSTILTYDTSDPAAVAAAAVVGSAATAARRDHVHVGGPGASEAEMVAASSTTVFASPGRTQYHPGVGKAWAKVDQTGTQSIRASYGFSGIADPGVGKSTLTFTTAMDDQHGYTVSCTVPNGVGCVNSPETTTIRIDSRTYAGELQDVDEIYTMVMGTQA